MVSYQYTYSVKMPDNTIIRDLTTEEATDLINNHNAILVSTIRTRVPEDDNVVINTTPNLTTEDHDDENYVLDIEGLSNNCTNGKPSDYIFVAGQGNEYKDVVEQLNSFNQ